MLRMLKTKIKWITAAVIILGALFTTCEMPMGLGEPIDTVPPNITILSPQDNTKMKAITYGNPIVLEGTWSDDIGVIAIQFDIRDKWHGNAVVTPSKTDVKITTTDVSENWKQGKWTAQIVILAETMTEYRIRAYALDKFANKGMSEVNVQIDIIPPWVDNVKIKKHPNLIQDWAKPIFVQDSNNYTKTETGSVTGKRDSLPNAEYYRKKISFNNTDSWRDIKIDDIDEFQNDFFRVTAELIAAFDNVAAVRLNIYRENGTKINIDMIKPSGYASDATDGSQLRFPYWDITRAQMLTFGNEYASGAQYISFEIRAWSKTDWEGTDMSGKPNINPSTNQEEQGRSQMIGGTVWFPESNNPVASFDKKLIIGDTNSIILLPNTSGALDIDVYDDDLLSEIYLGLIPKASFDTLRGSQTEYAFFDSLTLDTNATLRTNVMNACILSSGANPANPKSNLFTTTPDTANRERRALKLSTEAEGEYRLIALVKESASQPGYSYPAGFTAKWTAYPPLRVLVQAAMAPLIIVEQPLKENTFPNLNNAGDGFEMSGYALAGAKVNKLLIAWVPQSIAAANRVNAANTALESPGALALNAGELYTHTNNVKVWCLSITDNGEEIWGATKYYKTGFKKDYALLTDFPDGAVSAFNSGAKDNTFVIKAFTDSSYAQITYHLFGSSAQPTISVPSHSATRNYHDRFKDLVFKIQLGTGNDGVALNPATLLVKDITNEVPKKPDGLSAPVLVGNNEYEVKIPQSHIALNFPENGPERSYTFEVYNILGNKSPDLPKYVIMSNAPQIESIRCTNGNGTYAEFEELTFEVTFSMPLLLTNLQGNPITTNTPGAPRLKLYFNNVPLTEASNSPEPSGYADYIAPADPLKASNTLQFRYVVKLNDASNDLSNSLAPLDIPSGTNLNSLYGTSAVITINNHDKSMQTAQDIKLDGVKPKILRAYFTQITSSPPSYFNNGKIITVNLLCDEDVMVSGTPTINLQLVGNTIRNFTAQYSSKTNNVLSFTWQVADGNNAITPETQLTWATPWISFPTTSDDITDIVGNTIRTSKTNNTIPTAAIPADANKRGSTGSGYTDNKEAWVKTSKPNTPTLTIHSTQAGAQANTAVLTANPLNTNGQYFYMRVDGIQTSNAANDNYNTVYYSLTGGSNPDSAGALGGTGATRYSTTTTGRITDINYTNRISSTYVPSSYEITAWQTDRAGNESDKAAFRVVNINSRWAEVNGFDINLNDGSHPAGTVVPIKISLSKKVILSTATGTDTRPRVRLTLTGRTLTGTADIDTNNTAATLVNGTGAANASSLITVNWTVPSGIATMSNIKVENIQFTNITDEYDNTLQQYKGTDTETAALRPLTDSTSFQLNRPNLEIRSNRPKLTDSVTAANGITAASTSPVIPTSDGETQNGGMIAVNGQLVLAFSEGSANAPVALTAVPGKYITIRPYNEWALPPVLTVDQFNSVYNHANVANNSTYRRRLQDVDVNEIPKTGSGRGTGYNLYRKNTQGIVNQDTYVRPDTSTKMVLDFTTDLYEGTNATNLREIFDAAEWKWQKISVTSSYVTVNNNKVTVNFPQSLDPGRIWEVLIDSGAFQDAAGNQSEEVKHGTGNKGSSKISDYYRFWTEGTAVPVIRVDRVSYDARNMLDNKTLGFVDANNVPTRPPVDMRVRIDCETPGASITYGVIRTSYTLNPSADASTSDAFSSTSTSDTNFFHHTGFVTNPTNDGGSNTWNNRPGYQRNTIGNEDADTNKTNGFFNKLLVPNTVDTGTAALTNGAIPYTALSGLTTGTSYKTYATNGGITWNTGTGAGIYNTDIHVIYVGENYTSAYNSSILAGSNTDRKLYSGRRDYVAAIAQKSAISAATGTGGSVRNVGPALTASARGMEGVYKTTLVYRDPQRNNPYTANTNNPTNYLSRLLVQGFDVPVMPVVAGFPLRDADSTNEANNAYSNYFSKCAWRYGTGTAFDAFTATYLETNPTDRGGNNHVWVSWEIVTDWYQKAKGFRGTGGNYLNNNSHNANTVLGTYGAVIYRHQQNFYN